MDDSIQIIQIKISTMEEEELRLLEATEQAARNIVFSEIFGLISQGNEKQEEIFDIIVDILSIAKSQFKDEAKSKYQQVMKNLNDFTGDIETISKLTTYSTAVWKNVEKIFTSFNDL